MAVCEATFLRLRASCRGALATFEPAPFYSGRGLVQSVLLGGQRALSPPSRCCDPITREGGGLGRGANRSHDFWGRHRAGARPPEAERGSRHHKTTPATRIEEGTGKCLYQATLLIYKNPNIYWVFNYTSEIVLISLHLDHSVLPSPREGVPSAAPLYRWGNRGTGPGRESQSEWEFGSGHPETGAQVLTSAPRRPSNAPAIRMGHQGPSDLSLACHYM